MFEFGFHTYSECNIACSSQCLQILNHCSALLPLQLHLLFSPLLTWRPGSIMRIIFAGAGKLGNGGWRAHLGKLTVRGRQIEYDIRGSCIVFVFVCLLCCCCCCCCCCRLVSFPDDFSLCCCYCCCCYNCCWFFVYKMQWIQSSNCTANKGDK